MRDHSDPRRQEDEPTSWLWAGCWLLFIYITIPLARTIQEFVRDHGGSRLFLFATFAALGVAGLAVIRAVRRGAVNCRPGGMLVLGAILGVFASLTWSLRENPEESLHFVQYGVLSLLVYRALRHRLSDPSIYLAAAMIGCLCGIADELIQWIVPRRFFDYRDIAINAVAVLLVQAAIAFGLRPPAVRAPWSRRGVTWAFLAAATNLLLLLFCVNNTDALKATYTAWVPSAERIDETTASYGFQIVNPEIGSFYSRLTAEQLREQDRTRAAGVAEVLNRYKADRLYERFLNTHPAHEDPFLVEARVHLFRRDRHGSLALRNADDPKVMKEHALIAFREQQILQSYFGNTLAASAYAWPDHIQATLAKIVGERPPLYDSPVSRYVITSVTQAQLTGGILLVLLALSGLYPVVMRRMRA